MYSVYFIQQGSKGPIKIGIAKDVKKRLHDLQVGNPDVLYILTTISFESAMQAKAKESQFHRYLKAHHIRGEWFKPTIRIKKAIKKIAFEASLESSSECESLIGKFELKRTASKKIIQIKF